MLLHMESDRTTGRNDRPTNAYERGRTSRWVMLIYAIVALGAPLLLYAGPDSMSPAAPLIADKALDGEWTMRLHASAAKAPDAATTGLRR
jgi:hypothetical protein